MQTETEASKGALTTLPCGCLIIGYGQCERARELWAEANALWQLQAYSQYGNARENYSHHFFGMDRG